MTNVSRLKNAALLLAVSATVLMTACGRDDPAALLASARDYQAKNDHNAAVIQLKNVLQKQPENGEARLMLGRSALVLGDAPTAEKEFRRALEYGQAPATVVPLLAAAMIQAGESDKLVAEFGTRTLDDPKADAELRARIGEAWLVKGNSKQASEQFAAARQGDAGNVRAAMGQLRIKASESGLEAAVADAEKLVAANPDTSDAHLLLGELKMMQRDRKGATVALQKAVEAAPANPAPRLTLISLMIEDGQHDAAATQIAAARSARAPEIPLQYFEALLAAQKKDLAKARDIAQQVLKRAPGHVPSLVLLGGIELQEQHFNQAQTQLQTAVNLEPRHVGARALLARTYLASGQPARAMESLRPIIDSGTNLDPSLLMLVGEAQFATGELKQAAASFDAASKSRTQQPIAQTRLAQIALASGDVDGGVKQLEDIAAEEGSPRQADMALLTGYLRQGETGKALEVARGMVKKRPNDPAAHQAVGSVLVVRKDLAAARTAFSKAVELNPTYMPAVAALAQLDIQDRRPQDARARFEAVLAKDPKNEVALLGLAEMMARLKAPTAETVAVLQRAIAANPGSVNARVALVNLHLRERDTRAALNAAQEASAAAGKDSRVLEALGRAQLAAGDTNQAIDTFNRLAAAEPKSIVPLTRLAAAYVSRKEHDKAAEALVRAKAIAPADVNVTRDLALLYLILQKPDQALAEAKALQSAAPKSAAGFLLEGDIHAHGKELPAAEKAYRDGLRREPASSAAGVKLHSVLVGSGKKADADALARKWVADHPKDSAFRAYLGEQALRARDYKSAANQYEAVIAQQPDNALALNNLAWSLGQLNDPRALGFAERALKIAPDNASVLDTTGMLMLAKGDTKGLEYLSRAVQLAPQRHEIRLNYAKALLKAGRKDEARKELTQLQGVTQDFPGKSEVPDLLKQ